MHDYLLRPEVARVALVLGVVVSVLFYERFQLTTGGAIVPAYLAMFLAQPLYVAATCGIALATYLLVQKVFSRRWILYGRRRFEVELLTGLALVMVMTGLVGRLTDPAVAGLVGIGLLIPGIIAHDMSRQRPLTTLGALAATTAVVAALVFVFAALLEISPLVESRLPRVGNETGFPLDLLVFAAAGSVVAGMVVHARLGLRSGGYVSAAYLALFLARPADLLFTAVVALVIWLVVTRLVMTRLMVFGRRKLSAMLLVGAIVTWTAEVLVTGWSNGAFQPWKGFVLMSIMIPSLLANDAQRQGPERTLWASAICTLSVYGAMNVLQSGLLLVGA